LSFYFKFWFLETPFPFCFLYFFWLDLSMCLFFFLWWVFILNFYGLWVFALSMSISMGHENSIFPTLLTWSFLWSGPWHFESFIINKKFLWGFALQVWGFQLKQLSWGIDISKGELTFWSKMQFFEAFQVLWQKQFFTSKIW